VVQVATGSDHTLTLTDCGALFAFGDNTHGQLGLGDAALKSTLTPRRVEFLRGLPIRSIACGGGHSIAVSWSGAVYAWGKNTHGQLGLGSRENASYPKEVREKARNVSYLASC
jgi:E3 ubiquitin-protein ligase HERC4